MVTYKINTAVQARYCFDENGNTTVTVRSRTPLEPREVFVGEASMQFMWHRNGKTSQWKFTPSIIDPVPALYSEVRDVHGQAITVVVPKVFPASGLLDTAVIGEIRAPAIHFDLPFETDLWVFILRSPWAQLKVTVEKAQLNINHGLAYVTGQVENCNTDDTLRAYVTIHGEGFTNVLLNFKRYTCNGSTEECLGVIKYGALSATWRPFIRNFDTLLITPSTMTEGDFLEFLATMGAELSGELLKKLKTDFILCDGPKMHYELTLQGEKRYIGKEEDKTEVKLSLASSDS
jgi:hypothetical protein